MRQLRAADLARWRSDPQRVPPLLVDVREPWEYEYCRIDGSLSVPLAELGRRLPELPRDRPVVMVCHHGMRSMHAAAFLARAGFDCFTLDLRGHGRSRRGPTRRWNLDTYLAEDLPAALEAIRAATGEARVAYVGHSQGAILGMALCALRPDRVAALVALGGPAFFFGASPRLRRLVGLRHLGLGRHLRALARMVAPFSGYWHPAEVELAINTRNVERPIYRRLLVNALEDLQPGVLDQFAAFIAEDAFRSADGAVDYRAAFPRSRQPALFLSAEKDGLAPPAVVEAAFRAWGGPKRHWSCGSDYGHTDVLLGRNAPEVVFPVIRTFLLEHAEKRGGDPELPRREGGASR
jgi:pimeloyl-ACP methyl ester carboxylesterase